MSQIARKQALKNKCVSLQLENVELKKEIARLTEKINRNQITHRMEER